MKPLCGQVRIQTFFPNQSLFISFVVLLAQWYNLEDESYCFIRSSADLGVGLGFDLFSMLCPLVPLILSLSKSMVERQPGSMTGEKGFLVP